MQAFQRCLELDPQHVGASSALAVLELNAKTAETTRSGMSRLAAAHKIDRTSPYVTAYLAEHFFYRSAFDKASHLAQTALESARGHRPTLALSYLQLARCAHAQQQWGSALDYYRKVCASTNSVLHLWVHHGVLLGAFSVFTPSTLVFMLRMCGCRDIMACLDMCGYRVRITIVRLCVHRSLLCYVSQLPVY
jgi:hypothetical protein